LESPPSMERVKQEVITAFSEVFDLEFTEYRIII